MRLIIDLDGTICSEEKTYSRTLAKPKLKAVSSLKALKKKKYTLIIYSARSWNEYEMTINWLNGHEIPYDQVMLGKPIGDYWIDDRSLRFTTWKEILNQIK